MAEAAKQKATYEDLYAYADYQVQHLWLVDPGAKTLDVFRLETGKWLLLAAFAENDSVRAEPFSELEIDLANLWAE